MQDPEINSEIILEEILFATPLPGCAVLPPQGGQETTDAPVGHCQAMPDLQRQTTGIWEIADRSLRE